MCVHSLRFVKCLPERAIYHRHNRLWIVMISCSPFMRSKKRIKLLHFTTLVEFRKNTPLERDCVQSHQSGDTRGSFFVFLMAKFRGNLGNLCIRVSNGQHEHRIFMLKKALFPLAIRLSLRIKSAVSMALLILLLLSAQDVSCFAKALPVLNPQKTPHPLRSCAALPVRQHMRRESL